MPKIMESNESYYRRRAIQEIVAASASARRRNAITADAKARRRLLAETFLQRLAEIQSGRVAEPA
jgi:hypothetical protein